MAKIGQIWHHFESLTTALMRQCIAFCVTGSEKAEEIMTDDRHQRAREFYLERTPLDQDTSTGSVVDLLLAFADAETGRMCAWSLADEDASIWETACGHAFMFNDGGPQENGAQFCPYCGGKLKQCAIGCRRRVWSEHG